MNKDTITKKWNELLDIPLPEPKNDALFELTSTNSYSAGCITSYLEGKLNQECITILKISIINIKNMLPRIGKGEKAYYELLLEILLEIKEHKGF